MVPVTALWLPILLSAVLVFIVSSVIHMVLTYHRNDFQKLPDEERLLDAIRNWNVAPGDYMFPCPASPKDMSSPEMQEKYKRGPVGIVTMLPSGPPVMAKHLVQWFVYCLALGFVVAYLTGRLLDAGAAYLEVFRIAGTAAFLGHAGAQPIVSIWMSRAWSTTLKNMLDGLVYALVTAGTFGWLWPG